MRRKKGKEKMGEFQEDANLGTYRESSHGSHHVKDDGSHESVKSSNSKEFSTGKRERCFDSKSACKKLKQQKNEKAFPGTLIKKDSSFINWISGLAKNIPCSVQKDMPLALVPKASQSNPKDPCPPSSLDKGVDLSYGIGFQSIQTLHHARLKMPRMLSGEANAQHIPIDSCEFQIPNKPSVSACGRAIQISAKLNLHQPVPLATFRIDQYQTEELPLHAGIISASDFDAKGKPQYIGFNNHALCNLGSSSSSFHVATMEPRISEVGKLDSVLHSSNLLVFSGGSEHRGNFWIRRLCRRPPPPSSSGQINQVATSRTEMQLIGGNVFAPNLQNDNVLLEGIKCSEDVRITPYDNQNEAVGNEECSSSQPNSSFKGLHLEKMPKEKLNLILPPKGIKKIEPIAPVFAKRLDAFKHIRSPNIVNDLVYSESTCFFCGQTGHSMKDCSQVIGTGLERYQKNIKSYSGPKDSACLCIFCFQLTHWATACPYSSARVNTPCGASPYIAEINSERAEEQHVIKYSSLKESHHGEYNRNLVAHAIGAEEIKISDPKVIQNFSGESKYKGKNILRPSVHSKGIGNQITPVYSFHKTNTSKEQTCIFDGIKGLRLSRSDIVRLVMTPLPGLDLEGFFLRVRLGKQEETLEGSGYHVACIRGLSREKSIGTTKHHIPVDIGGFKCLLDSRFVSNNDFIEEELNAWWSMLSRSGTRPPTEEELSRKLAERKSFGL